VRCAALVPLQPSHVFAKQTADAVLLARGELSRPRPRSLPALLIASRLGVGSTLELRAPHLSNLVETMTLPSDVLSVLIAPDASFILAGLRNGKLLRLALGYEAPKGAGSKRQYRVVRKCRGAITALRWAGESVVLATSAGEVRERIGVIRAASPCPD